jgi:hypothetical protein
MVEGRGSIYVITTNISSIPMKTNSFLLKTIKDISKLHLKIYADQTYYIAYPMTASVV